VWIQIQKWRFEGVVLVALAGDCVNMSALHQPMALWSRCTSSRNNFGNHMAQKRIAQTRT
jgi:hypothetical protein